MVKLGKRNTTVDLISTYSKRPKQCNADYFNSLITTVLLLHYIKFEWYFE